MASDDYVDQVVRQQEYMQAHPGTRITYRVTHWEAVAPHRNGETITTARDLKTLLDKLEADT
jgi:hypothetical protein